MNKIFSFLALFSISLYSHSVIHEGMKVLTVSGFATSDCTFLN